MYGCSTNYYVDKISSDGSSGSMFSTLNLGLSTSYYPFLFKQLAVDSSDNVYVTSVKNNNTNGFLYRLTSSGYTELVSQINSTLLTNNSNFSGAICIDSTDNIYVSSTGTNGTYIFKINSSHTSVSVFDSTRSATSLTYSNGYIYAGMSTGIINKYDTSGNLIASLSTGHLSTYMTSDSKGNIYFSDIDTDIYKVDANLTSCSVAMEGTFRGFVISGNALFTSPGLNKIY